MGGSIKFDEHVSIYIYLYTCNLVPHSVIHTYNIYMCIEAKIKHFRHFHPCLIIQWFEGSSWELGVSISNSSRIRLGASWREFPT